MAKTSIEWTDASWNPIVGCTEVSPGCANCYAARLAGSRLSNVHSYKGLSQRIRYCAEHDRPLDDGRCLECRDSNGKTFILDMQSIVLGKQPRWTGQVRFLPDRLKEPLHWREPRRIFVCDMGDLFHEAVHGDWIDQVLKVIDRCPQHTFQILTKRAARMQALMKYYPARPNVWLGTSVENQHFADERIPELLATPAAVRFISAEPLLGPVDVSRWFCCDRQNLGGHLHLPSLDWVICGGESGPGARAMHPDWARSLRDQCEAFGVPFFFKQWGAWAGCGIKLGKKKAGRLLDGREWNEFPEGL